MTGEHCFFVGSVQSSLLMVRQNPQTDPPYVIPQLVIEEDKITRVRSFKVKERVTG